MFSWADTTYLTSLSYSVNGSDWITFNNSDGREEDEVISINVSNGDEIRWKGIANHIGDDGDNGCVITSDCEFDAEGNIMSLLYGDEFDDKTSLEDHDFAFSYLFSDINNGNECLIVNAENLVLPATTLAYGCYLQMFQDCSSLVTAPELPATTLSEWCYTSMFYGCTSLVTAPELPATTLAERCYGDMFDSCSSLVAAPELLATTLVDDCYKDMFYGCSSLSSITCLATDITASNCIEDWLYGVSSSGRFIKEPSMNGWTVGSYGVPSGWVVEDYDYSKDYFTVSTDSGYDGIFAIRKGSDKVIYYSINGGDTWIETSETSTTVTASSVMFKAYDTTPWSSGDTNGITCSVNYHAHGNLASLNYGEDFYGQTTVVANNYRNMFNGSTTLTSARDLMLVATTLGDNCYNGMFKGCINLMDVPQLPSLELANGCYEEMFMGCGSIETTPQLLAPILVEKCYKGMFSYCSSLNNIFCLATDISAIDCTYEWVDDVASDGTFTKAEEMIKWTSGINGIPIDWDVNDYYQPLRVWIDDFPSDVDYEEGSAYNKMVAEVADPEGEGANPYEYTRNTIEYDGNTYYLWEMPDWFCDVQSCSNVWYFVTNTVNFNDLYSQSLEDDLGNTFSAGIGQFTYDENIYNEQDIGGDYEIFLVKVEEL